MELELKKFDPQAQLQKQRELFNDCFPETNGESIQKNEHYFWKFHSFPANTHSFEYVAYANQEMVGYYAAIPYVYKIGNKITSAGMVCDVMTSSKHRGKGIFTKIGAYSTKELSQHVPFVTGYPIRKEVIPGHLKVGWKIAHELPLYIKFISFNTFLKTKNLGVLSPIANFGLRIWNLLTSHTANSKYSFEFSENIEDIKGYEDFIKVWINSLPNALQKDLSFSRWRYSAPERKYSFLTIREKSKIVGFVSFRQIVKESIPSFAILDYMVIPGFESCHGLINRVLSRLAKKNKVEAIMTMMSRTSASKYKLLRNGFLKSPFTFYLIIKNLTNEFSDNELFNEKNWHLMWVDSDDL